MTLNLDKTGWKRVAFGDVVRNVTERVDDPQQAGVDRYVGLEHLDPGVLTVQRWDSPEKVAAQKLRFYPGDVIFGRRRAYQKKVAMAEFEGICSAHALVLRADPNFVDPDFLPIFLASDYFLDRAISISVGSLSPTVNWRDLRVQEFDLPPLDEQQRIADLMWALERHRRSLDSQRRAFAFVRQTWIDEEVRALVTQNSADFSEFWEASPESGWSVAPVDQETGPYVLSLAALGSEGYRPGQLKSVPDSEEVRRTRLYAGDLLVSRANTVDAVGRAGIFDEERDDVSFPDTMMRMRLKSDVLARFAEVVLMSSHGRLHMRRSAAGSATSMVKINRRSLGRFPFPSVTVQRQRELVARADEFDAALSAIEVETKALLRAKNTFLADIFGGAA